MEAEDNDQKEADAESKASCEPDGVQDRLDALLLESDEFYDITCCLCFQDGRNSEAMTYCMECKQNLCDRCLIQHNRFELMKTHTLLPNNRSQQSEIEDRHAVQKCERHHNKPLDMYCKVHNEVCCVLCVAVGHSRCYPVENISKYSLTRTYKTLAESKEVLNKLNTLERTFKDGLRKKELASTTLEAQRREIQSKVDTVRQILNKRLDVLQDNLIRNLEERYGKNKDILDVGINLLTETVSMLEKEQSDLDNIMDKGNEPSKFVQVKLAEKSISQCRDLQETVVRETSEHIFYRPDISVSTLIDGITSIGSVAAQPSVLTACDQQVVGVQCIADRHVPTISGICMNSNREIFMTDWGNQNLKRFDQRYQITDTAALQGQPFDVCFVGDDVIAVSLTNQRLIQFIETLNRMMMTSSFKTGDACRGLAYEDGLLYVACGGKRLKKEGKGHIEVYNKSGEPVKLLSDNISYPGHIFVARSKVYVADNVNNLVVLDLDGKCISHGSHMKILNAMSVCDGPEGQIFLGGWTSHNVQVLTEDGQFVNQLLDKDFGINNLHTIYFDWLRSNLICTMRDSQSAVVFRIQYAT